MPSTTLSRDAKRSLFVIFGLLLSSATLGQLRDNEPAPNPDAVEWSPPTILDPHRPHTESAGTTPILYESAKLTASDAESGDEFGRSVYVSGNTAIVGAWFDDCLAGDKCGSAYVFRFDGTRWIEEQKLNPTDRVPGENLGRTVSISGDTAVVGGFRGEFSVDRFGAAYVFRFNGSHWIEEQKLIASDGPNSDEYGGYVFVTGHTIMVGARLNDCAAGALCGAVYVYEFNGTHWIEVQKLTASDAANGALFGTSFSVGGDTAVVGAGGLSCFLGGSCGAAYVFRFNGTNWVEEQKLVASDAAQGDWFGGSISVSGDKTLVGASWDDCRAGIDCGAAYVYRYDGTGWIEGQKLMASDRAKQDRYGQSASLSANTAVMGAPLVDCAEGTNCGAVYVYRFDGNDWVERQRLTAREMRADSWFGQSISMSGNTALVGAFRDNCPAGDACGAAYVFDLRPAGLGVAIDIKPGSDDNPVNLGARGVLPVAVLTTSVADGDAADFDAVTVDPSSLTLAGAAPRVKGRTGRIGSFEDVDGDGDLDLLVHFTIEDLDLTQDDTEAVLLGQTLDATPIRGSDTISPRSARRLGVQDIRRR